MLWSYYCFHKVKTHILQISNTFTILFQFKRIKAQISLIFAYFFMSFSLTFSSTLRCCPCVYFSQRKIWKTCTLISISYTSSFGSLTIESILLNSVPYFVSCSLQRLLHIVQKRFSLRNGPLITTNPTHLILCVCEFRTVVVVTIWLSISR